MLREQREEIFMELHLDTLITKPSVFFNKKIDLIHVTNHKKDVVSPITVNAGNKLSKPRFSSWWTPYRSQTSWIVIVNLCRDFKDSKWIDFIFSPEVVTDEYGTYTAPIPYIRKSFFEKHKKLIESYKVYVYTKRFKGSELGRGNEYSVDEYTVDYPVIPDKEEIYTFKDLKKYIRIVDDYEMDKKVKNFNNFKLHGKNLQDMVYAKKPWLYWELEVTSKIRNEYCKKHNIPYNTSIEYFRYTVNGRGIYEELKDCMPIEHWIKFKKSKNAKWLPVPDIVYNENYESWFTYDGMKMFVKYTLPICKKYINDKISFVKEKNIKNIVYKDKYQVVISK